MSGRRGFFLTLEGIEGCGKTTHARLLAEALEGEGYVVTQTREPGGTPLGEELRRFLLDTTADAPVPGAELFLILAARAQHVDQVIRPGLERGEVVLCDRFADATMAYQGGGRGLDSRLVAAANELAVGGVDPDLTVLFDISVDAALARVGRRRRSGGDFNRFDREARTFHENVRAAYLRLARENEDRFAIVNSERDKDTVAREIRTLVEPRVRERWKQNRMQRSGG